MKNKIGLSIILMTLICFISLPTLTLTASAQSVNSQTPQTPFYSIVNSPDFSIYASPSSLSITAGSSMNTTILVAPRYNFNGTISLSASAPDGWTASLNPSSLSLTNGYYGYPYYSYYYHGSYNWSTLSVAVPSGAAAGKYTITVTGTNDTLTHSANVTVNVVHPDFQLSAYPSYLSVTAGSTGNSTVMVSPLYSFNGTVSLSASVPSGWSASFVPDSLSITNGYYWPATTNVYYGYYNWSALSLSVPSDAVAGKYTVVVTGTSGSLTHSVNVTVNVVSPDFRLYVYSSYMSVVAGSTGNSTVLVLPLYGFNGEVSLSASCPSGWTATFASSALSLANAYSGYYYYGSYNWSTLSVAVPSGTTAGKYTVVVTGTSGSLTHSVNVTVNVVSPDFKLGAYSSYLPVVAGSTRNSTVIVMSLNQFNGTVSLSAVCPSGWTATFVPSEISLTNGYLHSSYYYGAYNWSTLSITVPPDAAIGKYTIVVTGTSGSLTHSINITVNVVNPDFQLYVFPPYLPVSAGSTGNASVLVASLYGFNGAISLSASVPAGWTASFNQSSLSLTNGYYYNWTVLSLSVPSDAAVGTYTVVVTGTSGSVAHSANVTVTVGDFDFWS